MAYILKKHSFFFLFAPVNKIVMLYKTVCKVCLKVKKTDLF